MGRQERSGSGGRTCPTDPRVGVRGDGETITPRRVSGAERAGTRASSLASPRSAAPITGTPGPPVGGGVVVVPFFGGGSGPREDVGMWGWILYPRTGPTDSLPSTPESTTVDPPSSLLPGVPRPPTHTLSLSPPLWLSLFSITRPCSRFASRSLFVSLWSHKAGSLLSSPVLSVFWGFGPPVPARVGSVLV